MTAAPAALLLAALLPLPGATTPAPAPGRALVPRGRWHHDLAGPPRLTWSVLFRRTDSADETRLLVETPAGRYVLVSTQPADGSGTREEVSVPELGESVSRLLEARPSGTVPECSRVLPPDACVVLSGSRGRLAAPLSAFFGEEGPALRRKAAGVVSPPLLARLAGLAPALQIDDLAFYCEDFLALLDPGLARPAREPRPAPPRLPGCAWDATFGYPCNADENRREEWLFRRTPPPAPR